MTLGQGRLPATPAHAEITSPGIEVVKVSRTVGAAQPRTVEDTPVTADRRHRRVRITLIPLFVLLILWLWLFWSEGAFSHGPNGKTWGGDFAMFLGAAQVIHVGGNPYDHEVLYRTERGLLRHERISMLAAKPIVRVGNPPLLFWAMQPLNRLPFKAAAIGWSVFLYLVAIGGFLALLRAMGWRRRLLPIALFILMPQVLFGPFYGNPTGICFAAAAAALCLIERYPYLAGLLLTLCWLKPPVALPIVMLILLFHAPNRRALVAGFVGGTALLLAGTLAATGPLSLKQWVGGLIGYSQNIAASPDITSLAGMYVRAAPIGSRQFFELATIAGALILTALMWHRNRDAVSGPFLTVAWLWVAWFLATPYAHFFDEVMLAIPILAFLGRDGRMLVQKGHAPVLFLTLGSILLISADPGGVQLLWIPLVGILIYLFRASRSVRLYLV